MQSEQQSKAVSLLARVILPRPGEPLDVRKLYIEESTTNPRRAVAPSRTSLEIGAESEVSFATYFNAFPASYWRRWSILTSVVLRAELTGSGRVDVYRSKATGVRIHVDGKNFAGENGTATAVEFEIGLQPFEDGGWIWFDITTEDPVTVHHAGWYAPIPAPGVASVAIGIAGGLAEALEDHLEAHSERSSNVTPLHGRARLRSGRHSRQLGDSSDPRVSKTS